MTLYVERYSPGQEAELGGGGTPRRGPSLDFPSGSMRERYPPPKVSLSFLQVLKWVMKPGPVIVLTDPLLAGLG